MFITGIHVSAVRMEETMYDKLEIRKDHRMNNLEYLGQAMTDSGNEFGPGTPYGQNVDNYIIFYVNACLILYGTFCDFSFLFSFLTYFSIFGTQ